MFNKNKVNDNKILSVTNGKVNTLASIKDGVFSEKMLGDGVVIEIPQDTKTMTVVAPISGTLVTVFPTGHAYGVKTKDGVEVLVHIGLDTVNLDGEGFIALVKQGDKIKAGEPMAEVDVALVSKKAPSVNPIVIITSGQEVKNAANGKIEENQTLFEV